MKVSLIKKIITLVIKALGLHIEENGTIKKDSELPSSIETCNNKAMLLDDDSRKSISMYYILLKFYSNSSSCTYTFFNKHIHSTLESKIGFLFIKIIGFIGTYEDHNQSDSKGLNQLLFSIYEENDLEMNNEASKLLINKWKEVISIVQKQSFHNHHIYLKIKRGFIILNDFSAIKSTGVSKINADADYVYSQSYFTNLFPMYNLLQNAKDSKILGVEFTKQERNILLHIYEYIFQGIKSKDKYKFTIDPLWTDSLEKKKQRIIINYKPASDTFILIKLFVQLSKTINTVIDDLSFLNNMSNQKIDIFGIDTLIDSLKVPENTFSPVDFEYYNDSFKEKMRYKPSDIQTLNDNLNSLSTNTIETKAIKKTNKKSNYSFINKSFISSNQFHTSPTSNIMSILLDPMDESFSKIMPLKARLFHKEIIAGSGSGKSECIKAMALKDFQDTDSSFILLDGAQKLALELAKLVDKPERLVYIDASLNDRYSLSINPLDTKDKSSKNLSIMAKHLSRSFELLMESDWSPNMEALLIPIIYVLMEKGGFDIFDLKKFMDEAHYDELLVIALGSSNKNHRDFIQNDLNRIKTNKSTRDAIYMKLQSILSDNSLEKCITGKSTINLEKLINTPGKIIIVKPESTAFGILLMAMVQGIVEKRDVHHFIHTYMYVDEFQNFVSPTSVKILSEQRKKGLHLTMAHQELDQIKEIKSSIFANTGVKIVGKNSHENLSTMAKEIQIGIKELENLEVGEFYIKVGINQAIKVRITDKFIDQNGAMCDKEWKELSDVLLKKYYKLIENNTIPVISEEKCGTSLPVPEIDEF